MSVLICGRINNKTFRYEYEDIENIYDALTKLYFQEGVDPSDAEFIEYVNTKTKVKI